MFDRINNWIKALASLHNKEFSQAVSVLKMLDERTPLRGNHSLLVLLGEVLYYQGQYAKACDVLMRVTYIVNDSLIRWGGTGICVKRFWPFTNVLGVFLLI